MARFIVKRILGAIPLLLAVSFVVFSLLYIAPGNPVSLLAGGRVLSRDEVAALSREFNLNKPFLVQYAIWVSHVARGQFGQTIVFHDTVMNLIRPRVLPTLELATYALVLIIIAGMSFGTVAAARQGTSEAA